jgi:hypothetical protein
MCTQNSETESGYLYLTYEPGSGESRIKSVCLNTLDRTKGNVTDGCVTRKREG